MNRTAMVRQAFLELGDAPAQEICSFIEKKYSVKIEPKILPLFKATIRDLENLTQDSPSRKSGTIGTDELNHEYKLAG